MSPPLADPGEARTAAEALLTLCTALLEAAVDLTADAKRDDHLGELAELCSDLDLFARAVVRAKTYDP